MLSITPLNNTNRYLNNLQLFIEADKNKLRIVLLAEGKEIACRKESAKAVESFLHTDETIVFKGRLQLQTSGNNISIYFKKELIGNVNKNDFLNNIIQLKKK